MFHQETIDEPFVSHRCAAALTRRSVAAYTISMVVLKSARLLLTRSQGAWRRGWTLAGALAFALVSPTTTAAQQADSLAVDPDGVMRWTDFGDEVALFGVNYSPSFAFGYRAIESIGADHRAAIDADAAHLARLGLDAYRIHVWDREISDRDGNLVDNDHLALLDYTIARFQQHGIRTILTPIAWWGPGYPAPDPPTTGFSGYFTKGESTTDPEARRAQVNYLAQFITHVNRYNGLSYRDDPGVIAVEIFNEPIHPGGPTATTEYVSALAGALRDAGFRKPIFYNISEDYTDENARAVCASAIDGVGVQWYPTGLVRNASLGGNMLPNADRYPLPFADFPDCRNKARMVYEFDASDVPGSYLYPAMARSFRAAGFQWATQFSYDPLPIAYSNTDYQTHFLNLVYSPARAVSFMIAGEAFRRLPRGDTYGTYPETERFGPFRVSYDEDLSELVTDSIFYHSNHTRTAPPRPASLRRVAGVGTSALVSYQGTGAYFLDRLDDGVWRLELYPDAVWVADPFARASLDRVTSRIVWRTWPMSVALPDLGDAFHVQPLDAGNDHRPDVRGGTFDARPGVYLLTRTGATAPPADAPADIPRDFIAPASTGGGTVVRHEPFEELLAGAPHRVRATVVTDAPADSVALFARRIGQGGPQLTRMRHAGGYEYEADVAERLLVPGEIEYGVVVFESEGATTFPSGVRGHPLEWDFVGREYWSVPVIAPGEKLILFDARRDRPNLLYPHRAGYVPYAADFVGATAPGRLALRVVVESFEPAPHHGAIRTFIPEGQRARLGEARDGVLNVRARGAEPGDGTLELALVETDGTAWGTTIALPSGWQDIEVSLDSLQRVPLALLPRPYPIFLPYTLESATTHDRIDLERLDGLQFILRPGPEGSVGDNDSAGFEIERVLLR